MREKEERERREEEEEVCLNMGEQTKSRLCKRRN